MISAAILLYSVCLVALFAASLFDIKTREVPDWLNFSLIFMGLGMRGIFSVIDWDFSYLLNGLFGFLAFLLLAYVMFYAGQWGGGDSKLLMGVGAVVGLELNVNTFLFGFFINLLVFGALYGLIWVIFYSLKKRKQVAKKFAEISSKERMKRIKIFLLLFSVIVLVAVLFVGDIVLDTLLFILLLGLVGGFYMWIFIKAVELTAMHKLVSPEKLTEGDWIVKDVNVDGKRICGPKDLGIEKEQIAELIKLKRKGKVKKVLIKEGIPFVPGFFIAFIATMLFGNFMLGLIL